ncbi:MAG TPA: hypothetical protein VLJ59_02130 [Mycobacteriales bacterium]|nr:hypothetical protein [Mycobacteriales bacterium]
MANTNTYDPILDLRELPRFRVFGSLPPPGLGTALVLEPGAGNPLVINAGERVPDARLGHYRRSYLVDLKPYRLRLEEWLPSRDPAFLFETAVTFTCRAEDPALVACTGIRDVTAALRNPLVAIMRPIAQQYDIAELSATERALNQALQSFGGDRAFRLGGYLVELAVGGDAIAGSAAYHDTSREIRLEEMRRKPMSEVVAAGRDELVAQWLTKHGGDPDALLGMEADAKELEVFQILRAMEIVSSSGEKTESFETREQLRRLSSRFMPEPGAIGPPERGGRRSRLSGSLTRSSSGGSDRPSPDGDGARADQGGPLPDSRPDPDRAGRDGRDPDRNGRDDGGRASGRNDADDGGRRASRVRGRQNGQPAPEQPARRDPAAGEHE